jgi:hypothetical protein
MLLETNLISYGELIEILVYYSRSYSIVDRYYTTQVDYRSADCSLDNLTKV